MKLRNSLLARSAVVLTVIGFMPVPAAAADAAIPGAGLAASGAAAFQSVNRTRARQTTTTHGADGEVIDVEVEFARSEEITAAAQTTAAATGTQCQITEAVSPGQVGETTVFEIACASGPGYIMTDGPEPTSRNCIVVSQQAEQARLEDPEAPAQVICQLSANQNLEAVMASYVAASGIDCQLTDSRWVGRTNEGEERYEIGCQGAEGYWIDISPAQAFVSGIPCLEVTAGGGECLFTPREQQLAVLHARFASAAQMSCTPQDARYVGGNDNYRFYEVKCAEGVGYIGQVAQETGEVIDARDCVRPQLIPGGCTLTDTSDALAEAGDTRLARLAAIGRSCTPGQERLAAMENRGDGTPGREIYEYECPEQPIGLVGYFPVSGEGEVEAYDCFTMDARGYECGFTSRGAINAVLTSMVTASQRNCNVVGFRVVARMAQDDGDVAEVKCDDGRGWFGEFPDNREAAGQLLPCAAAARQGDACVL